MELSTFYTLKELLLMRGLLKGLSIIENRNYEGCGVLWPEAHTLIS